MSATIVVGWAGARASGRALAVAAELGRDLGTTLVVAHVVVLEDYPIDPDSADFEAEADRHLATERAEVEARLRDAGLSWSYTLARGEPVAALSRVAEQERARFIVVGTRAGSGYRARLEHLLRATPSVTTGLEHAGVPVIVVPAEAS